MAQKLIMPINQALLNASYKYPEYESLGYGTHYGTDIGGTTTMYASGIGKVVEAGEDSVFGNTVILQYDDAYIPVLDKVTSVVVRCFHLASIAVSKGDSVTKDTVIGVMGETGRYVTGVHLHIEVDTDCDYPTYTPSLSGNATICKAGVDTTLNPMKVFYLKTTAPDSQTMAKNSRTTWQTDGEIDMLTTEDTEYVASVADNSDTESSSTTETYTVGQTVRFSTCYKSSTAKIGLPPDGEAVYPSTGFETGTITKIYEGRNNPYLINDGQCFVNDGDIREVIS